MPNVFAALSFPNEYLQVSIFKAYDIRGTYPDQIDAQTAFRIGAAMVRFLSASRLVVGRDMRTMAPEIQDAVIEGMLSQG